MYELNCTTNTRQCRNYLDREVCRETCPYAEELRSYGVGAMIIPPRDLRRSNLEERIESSKQRNNK